MISEIKLVLSEFSVGVTQLRIFGLVCAAVFGLLYYHFGSALLLLFVVVMAVISFGAPRILLPVVKILIALTYPIGWVLSRTLLTALYIVILTPIGLLRKLIRGVFSSKSGTWHSIEANEHHDRMSL